MEAAAGERADTPTPVSHQNPGTWPGCDTSSLFFLERVALGKAPSPRSWPWLCATRARRWES
uniref:Nucleotide binding protein 2 n=1 Tax=Mus musculus TaxID=10090 RepID=A0A3Q4L2Y0_MOUSE